MTRNCGSETDDLTLNRFGIVFGAAIRNVAVSPGGVLAGWGSARIEK